MHEIRLSLPYGIGDIVFLRVNTQHWPGMVTALVLRPDGVMIQVTWAGGDVSSHFEMELTDTFVPSDWPDEADDEEEAEK